MVNLLMTIAFILLTIVLFKLSLIISNKFKIALLNPILISAIIIIIILKVFNIPYRCV